MCVPTVAIREDGKGFMVLKGGTWWLVGQKPRKDTGEVEFGASKEDRLLFLDEWGYGPTILEAVDAALAKLHKGEGGTPPLSTDEPQK